MGKPNPAGREIFAERVRRLPSAYELRICLPSPALTHHQATDRRRPRQELSESDLYADLGCQRDQRFLQLDDRRGDRVELARIVRHVFVDAGAGGHDR